VERRATVHPAVDHLAAAPVFPFERESVRGLRATIDLATIGIAHVAGDGRSLLTRASSPGLPVPRRPALGSR